MQGGRRFQQGPTGRVPLTQAPGNQLVAAKPGARLAGARRSSQRESEPPPGRLAAPGATGGWQGLQEEALLVRRFADQPTP